MSEQRTYPAGVPCWVQLETADTAAAADFYGALFGWEFAAADPRDPGAFLFARLDGQDVGALARSDAPAGWVSFIACDDVEAACAAVSAAGGIVIAAPDAGSPFGRGATCADPQGAVFHLWQAGSHPGSQVVNAPGAWNFSDLHTGDAEASLAFYGAAFGWRVDAGLGAGMIRLPGYGDHLAATSDPDIHERQRFAPEGFADVIAGLTPTEGAAAEWWIRFAVADRDASVAVVEKLGGSVETVGQSEWVKDAVVRDPAGARFVVSQFSPRD
jgi:uncharacterized protein